jgi:hypothetical protein
MEGQIKRGTYFDGQFLQQAEFNDEGDYHRHMRRRINYTLFDGSGVLELTTTDLRITIVSVGAKTFQVQPGTAISVRPGDAEGKEVLLRAVSPTLDVSGFPAAVTTAWVTIKYLETPVASPPSPGSLLPTRVIEDSIIEVHQAHPPAVDPAAPHEEYIILGTIALPGMTPGYAPDRMVAHLRAALLGGVTTTPAATITGISVASGTQGTVVPAVITGTNLGGVLAVAFSAANVAAVVNGPSTATAINVTINIPGNAAVGPGTFTVTVAAGIATSAPGAFTVLAATPVSVTNVVPSIQNSGAAIEIRGTNIRNSAIAPPAAATGTTVQLLDPGTSAVRANLAIPTAMTDLVGPVQRVSAVIPAGAQFTPPQANGTTTNVKVQVTFGGGTGVWAGTLQVNF